MTDFNLDSLHQLVDQALTVPVPSPSGSGRLGLGLGEGHLLATLADILPKHLDQATIVDILDQLRREAYQGVDVGSLPALRSVVGHCHKCPALSGPPWPGLGNMVNPDVVFVTETPFDTDTAQSFRVTCTRAGFLDSDICVLGATRCRAPSRRPAAAEELAHCADYLHTEIALLAPKLIVTLGAAAAVEFIGPFKITDDHGRMFWLGPWPVLPVFSPSYAEIRDQQAALDNDLGIAHRFIYGS